MNFTEFTGKTVEEAVEKGLKELGLTKETAEIRVLEEGKKKLFGSVKARVEIAAKAEETVEVVEEIPAVQEVAKNKNIIVATGGIITTWQAQKALEAGSKLLVSPILQMGLVKFSSWNKIPLILSASTPNDNI